MESFHPMGFPYLSKQGKDQEIFFLVGLAIVTPSCYKCGKTLHTNIG